jgi:hypothetical protein
MTSCKSCDLFIAPAKLPRRQTTSKQFFFNEKGTKLRKRYEYKKKVRSYEHGTKLRKKGTKMLRNKLRKTLVMKLPSYEIVTPPIGIIYYDVMWCIMGNLFRSFVPFSLKKNCLLVVCRLGNLAGAMKRSHDLHDVI